MRGFVGVLFLVFGVLSAVRPGAGQEPEPVVHAVLFYSSTCPHCHQLITETLIPMQEEYGSRLVILGFDTTQPRANNLYYEALRHYKIGQEDWVVPILIVKDEVMVGGTEIPRRFPAMVEEALAGDGIDLPDFPALLSLLRAEGMLDLRFPDRRIALQDPPVGVRPEGDTGAEVEAESEPEPEAAADPEPAQVAEADTSSVDSTLAEGTPAQEETVPEVRASAEGASEDPAPGDSGRPEAGDEETTDLAQALRSMESRSLGERFGQDPVGNSASVVVLLFMLLSLGLRGWPPRVRARPWPSWVVPVLVVVGVGVAAYLSYIEVTQNDAVCGPVGDCNTVNQSEYAFLFGVLPVGVLGLAGYGVILLLWATSRVATGEIARRALLGSWVAVLAGTLFSVYLTFLEPFVIGASCAWCLTSAVVMTLLLWAVAPLAREAWVKGDSLGAG